MPKIFEYLGVEIFFYSNEHQPIHVHAKYGREESKAEFTIVDGNVVEITIREVVGARPLSGTPLNHFKEFLETYADRVVQKWIDYFVLNRKVSCERITGRVK